MDPHHRSLSSGAKGGPVLGILIGVGICLAMALAFRKRRQIRREKEKPAVVSEPNSGYPYKGELTADGIAELHSEAKLGDELGSAALHEIFTADPAHEALGRPVLGAELAVPDKISQRSELQGEALELELHSETSQRS